jgi:hypothetical protein
VTRRTRGSVRPISPDRCQVVRDDSQSRRVTTFKPFGAMHRVSPILTVVFVDDGDDDWHIAKFTTEPKALAYLASLGYCVLIDGKFYRET